MQIDYYVSELELFKDECLLISFNKYKLIEFS